MRVDDLKGFYIQYKQSGQPVEVLDKEGYAFQAKNDRTCFVSNKEHVSYLLQLGDFEVIGVEVDEPGHAIPQSDKKATTFTSHTISDEAEHKPVKRRRGRPPLSPRRESNFNA